MKEKSEPAELWTLFDHRVKLKEREKKDKYMDLARELKKILKLEIVIVALSTVTKGLIQGQEGLEIRG